MEKRLKDYYSRDDLRLDFFSRNKKYLGVISCTKVNIQSLIALNSKNHNNPKKGINIFYVNGSSIIFFLLKKMNILLKR